jgi:Mn2+/Fe2+ NRAMP family transporter
MAPSVSLGCNKREQTGAWGRDRHSDDRTSCPGATPDRWPVLGTIVALGGVGTGLLSVPVLARSAVGDATKWPTGRAPADGTQSLYAVICVAMIVGIIKNFTPVDPIKALYRSAVISGIVAVPLMAVMMWLAAAPKVMGDITITGWAKILG